MAEAVEICGKTLLWLTVPDPRRTGFLHAPRISLPPQKSDGVHFSEVILALTEHQVVGSSHYSLMPFNAPERMPTPGRIIW